MQTGAAPVDTAAGGGDAAVRSGFVPILRLGFVVAGGGEIELECSGSDCPTGFDQQLDYDDKSGFVLGADFLGHATPNLRLGGGVLFAPSTQVEEEEDGGEGDLGADLSLLAIVEGVFDVGPTVALAVRGFAGAAFVLAGDDLEDANDEGKEQCSSDFDTCDFDEGSNVAFTFGVGGGVIFQLESVALRADLLYQRYSGGGRSTDFESIDAKLEESISGDRVLLMGGLEF